MTKRDKYVIPALLMGALACITGIARAQETPDKPKAPTITSEMREDYFQAKADVLELQAGLAEAQKRLEAAVAKMQAVCPLIVDPTGKPQCAPKPEPPEPVKPETAKP